MEPRPWVHPLRRSPRARPLLVSVICLSGCAISINDGSPPGNSSRDSGQPPPGNVAAAEPTPAPTPTPTPTPQPFGTCQLASSGHNARVTLAGPGVNATACSGLLPALGSSSGGWVIVSAPPPALPTTDVICSVPVNLLQGDDQGVVTDYGTFSTSYGSAACTALSSASLSGPCPPTITGQITGAGNRIPLQIEVSGPSGSVRENAILDTGGVDVVLPDTDLQSSGFSPSGTATTSVGGWTGTVDIYSIPGSALLVLDAGAYVPLATGALTVEGAPASAFADGVPPLVGPTVLQQGARLSSSGSQWALTPACSTP